MDAKKTVKKRRKLRVQDKKLAQRIRELRIENNMTQEELGEKLKVNLSYVAYIETFRRGVSLPILYKVAKVFNVKVKDLFTF